MCKTKQKPKKVNYTKSTHENARPYKRERKHKNKQYDVED